MEQVRHLRTIHFSLVAASVVLLIADNSPPPRQAELALSQAKQIRDVISVWHPVKFRDHVAQAISKYSAANVGRWKKHELTSVRLDVTPKGNGPHSYVKPTSLLINLESAPYTDTKIFGTYRGERFRYKEFSPPGTIKTLGQFVDLWNRLHALNFISIVDKILLDRSIFVKHQPDNKKEPVVEQYTLTNHYSYPQPVMETTYSHNNLLPNQANLKSKLVYKADIDWLPKNHTITRTYAYFLVVKVGSGWGKTGQWATPVSTNFIPVDGQGYFTKQNVQSQQWSRGSFKDAFAELHAVAGSLPSLSFDELITHLSSQAKSTEQSLPIFSVELPMTMIRTWGIFVLALVQLYFLVHYRKFLSVAGNANKTAFPWIGLYTDKLSKTVFLISIMAPPVVSGRLAFSASGIDQSAASSLFIVISAAFVILMSCILIWVIARSWGWRGFGSIGLKQRLQSLYTRLKNNWKLARLSLLK